MRLRVVLIGLVGVSALAAIGAYATGSARLASSLAVAGAVLATACTFLLIVVTTRQLRALDARQRRAIALTRRSAQQQRRRHQAMRRQNAAARGHMDERLASIDARLAAVLRTVSPPQQRRVHTPQDVTNDAMTRVASLRFDPAGEASVVLVLQSFGAGQMFAGIRTAVVAAGAIASLLARPLRVIVLEPSPSSPDECHAALSDVLAEAGHDELAARMTLSVDGARRDDGHHPHDVWVATFWTTAYGLGELVRAGRVAPDHVVYLVQDWEPSFYPWGDLHAKALSTYGLGFHIAVNSRPLARYVADVGGVHVDPGAVFAPEIGTDTLTTAAARWTPGEPREVRLLFYARPSKPRNMFTLGLQAIQEWATELPDDVRPVVRLAGEDLGPVDLGERVLLETLGKTSYDEYYRLLESTDVGLALMNSPHPGHLALELPLAGIPTVTNAFGPYREAWIDGLVVADPHPRALAARLRETSDALLSGTVVVHRPGGAVADLGVSLADAMRNVVRALPCSTADVPEPSTVAGPTTESGAEEHHR